MKLSLSNKLFLGFTVLSLLTILLGVTTFTVIEQMAESQKNMGLLQEFELRVNTLGAITATHSDASFISEESYKNFLANLDKTKKIAGEILLSDYCSSPQNASSSNANTSCQSIMLEATDSYPQAATEHYDRAIFTLRLITKNRYIYRKMMEAAERFSQNSNKQRSIAVINQLEMLKHDFEESNDLELIEEMNLQLPLIENLEPESNLKGLAKSFIENCEQTYLNRKDANKNIAILSETINRFNKTSKSLVGDIIEKNSNNQKRILALIMFLSLVSIALTLLFWLLASRRFTRFLNNQKKAINSIKSGYYDYEIKEGSKDELSELCTFTKSLALNIKEEIDVREYSQREKQEIQSQFMQAQKLESLGMLTSGIAHDFNNILTGIIGYTDLALARLEDDHPVKRYLETISRSGQKASEMTRQLLAFSRKQELNKEVINLNALASNLLKIMNRMIGENVILELETTPELPNVMADPSQVEQVLMNLAVNSKDAMPEGGKIVIATATTNLDESAVDRLEGVDPGQFVQISITDNGIGMTDEIKKKIFDPFFTTKESSRGTGLGLATVFEIIKDHNGHITLDSTLGQGTTINLFLPAIDGALTNNVDFPASAPTIARGQETILLVDDNDTARDFICETLEYCGYKLLTASSGSEAVKIMHQTDYTVDLLLTDVIMPGMNGKELAEIVRKVYPETKVVFMSGYDDLSGHNLDEMPSGEVFLKKPMSVDTLSRKVRTTLDL